LLKREARAVLMSSVLLLLLCSTLAIGVRAWFKASLDVVSITISDDGFAPSEITRAAGSFSLAVSNQSGAGGLTLKLTRDNGETVQEISMPQGAEQWSGEVTLSSGGYTLTEANHPAWLFHITAQ
jgi:hypothetical protein